jgi:hypothetical protein
VQADNPQTRPLPLSQRLVQIIEESGPDRLSFSELAAQLHARAWGGLLLIFAAINILPLPPGTSVFFAIPIMLVSAQMVFGRDTPWFPARLDRRGVTKQELHRLIDKMEWVELRIERIFKPRLPVLTGQTAARLIGVVCLLLARLAAIPIPLFHVAPAIAIVLFGIALIYRDGALIIAAAVAAVLALIIDAVIFESGFLAIEYAVSWLKP